MQLTGTGKITEEIVEDKVFSQWKSPLEFTLKKNCRRRKPKCFGNWFSELLNPVNFLFNSGIILVARSAIVLASANSRSVALG